MGSKLSCCKSNTPRLPRKERKAKPDGSRNHSNDADANHTAETECLGHDESSTNLQHISEREPEDLDSDPSTHPSAGPLFMRRSRSDVRSKLKFCIYWIVINILYPLDCKDKEKHRLSAANIHLDTSATNGRLNKASSCSTIFLDDSTVSHPNLKNTIKCVTLAIYYHIKNDDREVAIRVFEIFDERIHPLSREPVPQDVKEPDHRTIYRFVRTLFNAAQLPPECAIITLVYLERLLTYAETDIVACSWKRIVLGAILLASKVWDDQAVWNVDYCQILRDITVEDMYVQQQ